MCRSAPTVQSDPLRPTSASRSPNIVDRCPDSVLGNGTAKFALAQIKSPTTLLDGVIVVFNGGLEGGVR